MKKVPFLDQKSQILMEGQKTVQFQIEFFSELLCGCPKQEPANFHAEMDFEIIVNSVKSYSDFSE